ncbi:MAG: hypothetical protein COA49_10240 [Bacteroidetes bacterium]|nr:MAG: hypothetical protein COA49_10240 [Bacteroidota bacterium]
MTYFASKISKIFFSIAILFLLTSTNYSQTVLESGFDITLTYPYNPEYQGNNVVGIADLLPFLITFGQNYTIGDITINELGGMPLTQFIGELLQVISSQQAALNQLTPLLEYIEIDTLSQSVKVIGANLIVNNGSGSTYGEVNGLGNIIIGYNENEGGFTDIDGGIHADDLHTGSHNLIIGPGHTFTSTGGIVAGRNNTILSLSSSVLGGRVNLVSGEFTTILGGLDNLSSGSLSTVSGGHLNISSGDRSTVSGGLLNFSAGIATSILGGQYMQIFEQYETASGQYDINN